MTEETIQPDVLAALDIVAMERLDDGQFKLLGAPPAWFAQFYSQLDPESSLLPQQTFLFLEQFLTEAETFWESSGTQPLRSGVWSEAYSSARQYSLEASALRIGERKLLVIERVRSAYGDIQALAQKSRDKNLDYDRLRHTEEALRKSEERYRDLFENATDLIQSCSADGKLIYVNRSWREALGYDEDEVPGLSIFDIIHPSSRAHCQEMFGRVMSGEKVDQIGAMFVTKDGRTIAVEGSSSCRFKDGKPVATRSIFRDITERKRAEDARRKSEQQLQAILDNSTAVIYLKDYWGRYILVNSRFETLFHVSKAQVVGKTDLDFFPREMAEAFQANDRKVLEARTPLESEEIAPHDDGPHIYLSVKFPICDVTGEPYAICGISTDITDRKRMEADLAEARDAALESARLKAEFLANMSHEIRTPINAVIGMTGLLLDTDLSAEQREYASTVRTSADALLTIINDILDFSKIEAGKLTFEIMDFDLRAAVEGAVELLAEAGQSKGLELFSIVYDDVPSWLRGDPGRLRQVLANLVSNAVKFTERGEVVVRVTKETETADAIRLRFSVTDTGIGILEEARRLIFDAFSQADGSTTRKYGGTGLGLAISKQLVERMEGEIGVDSAPGRGSTFWFTARFGLQPHKTSELEDKPQLEGLRVLVVDDNETNRTLVHHQITSWGMRNGNAASGAEALKLLRLAAAAGDAYKIAILDMQMPEMDGLMLAREIKADQSIAGTRLVMMTSLGPRDDNLLKQSGIEVCLRKPVKQSQLFDCLATVAASRLPEVESSSPVNVSGIASSQDDTGSGARALVRVLVAEDNVVNQRVALRQLHKMGYSADGVANGLEVLESLERISYDVVLMDCQMPEMDGFEATAEIRKREGSSRHTIIVAMTANAFDGERERCVAGGMDDYISKPVRPEVMSATIERWTAPSISQNPGTPSGKRSAGEPASIDVGVMSNLRALESGSEPSLVAELIDSFLRDSHERITVMQGAAASGDANALTRTAHALKGGSGIVGANRMAALCDIIEELGRTGSVEGTAPLITALEGEFERVRRALQAEKSSAAEKGT
ncbi:MAG TPA: PAS domain S-box protein [Blastocatellia bacterium]|nr:PAS domain S-box protein [Blastocatellia bacterium]